MHRPVTVGASLLASALIAVIALPGVATATPEPPTYTVVFDSPSALSVEGRGATTAVSYANDSGRVLECFAVAGDPVLIGQLYDDAIARRADIGGPLGGGLTAATSELGLAGRLDLYGGVVVDGATEVLGPRTDELFPDIHLTDGSFASQAYSECWDFSNHYLEIERTAPVDLLGSVENLLGSPWLSGSLGLPVTVA